MASSAKEIGKKYGQSTADFTTSSNDAAEQIALDWTNEGIALMSAKIRSKARTGSASTLAQDMIPKVELISAGVSVKVITKQDYADYVDKGVRGVKKNKAPNSPYKFKNLGTPPKMIKSFKQYIARTGMKSAKINGKRKSLYKTNKKEGTKTARMDRIDQAAQQLAVATKIGGIEPMNYKEAAVNDKRVKQLAENLSVALGQVLISKIVK
jgi:hypothetical protein